LFDTDFAIYVNFNRTQNRKTEIPQCYCGTWLIKENQLVVCIVLSLFVSVRYSNFLNWVVCERLMLGDENNWEMLGRTRKHLSCLSCFQEIVLSKAKFPHQDWSKTLIICSYLFITNKNFDQKINFNIDHEPAMIIWL
jgi:hypothetical protein